jgi:hypothetical protein
MALPGPKAEYKTLAKFVAELEEQFLKPYLVATTTTIGVPSRKEALNAGAYVVLAHGALENFVEGLALWILGKVVHNWTMAKRVTRSTASILLYQGSPSLADESVSTVFDNIRQCLDESNTSLSNVIRDNNGITPRHLRTLFLPLGVDVPNDAVLTASLETIVTMRHYWAHQYRHGASVVKSASDAKLAVDDGLVFAKRLADEVAAVKP